MSQNNASPPLPPLRWHERLNAVNLTALLFLLAVLYAATHIEGSSRPIPLGETLRRKWHDFFPPDFSGPVVTQALEALHETVLIALVATCIGIALSLPLGLAAAQNIAPPWLLWLTRMTHNAVRTIPSLIWAVLTVSIFGANALAGVVALAIYSVGYLAKFFSEACEALDMEVARGLRAIGASPFQATVHGLWPQAKPLLVSYSLWMLEYNIRSAAIVGYVGAGGIGVQLHAYASFAQWQRVSTILLMIFVIVSLLDFAGERLRRRILAHTAPAPLQEDKAGSASKTPARDI